jgi:hypothetical protein
MSESTSQTPASAAARRTEDRRLWLILGGLVVGLILVIAPFPWNRWRPVHSREARKSVEFKVAQSVREALQSYRNLEDGRLPERMRDLEHWLADSEERLLEEGKPPAWLTELKLAGFLMPPDRETQSPPRKLGAYFFYFPKGVVVASGEAARREQRLIVISAASLTAAGRSEPGRYGLWLDRDEEITGPTWIPESEAQDYLKIAGDSHRP